MRLLVEVILSVTLRLLTSRRRIEDLEKMKNDAKMKIDERAACGGSGRADYYSDTDILSKSRLGIKLFL